MPRQSLRFRRPLRGVEGDWRANVATYRRPALLRGGKASLAHKRPVDFERAGLLGELQRGVLIEYEHTRRFDAALAIAMDHLCESPYYYLLLETMERKMHTLGTKKKQG